MAAPAYPVAGHGLLVRAPDGRQLVSFCPSGSDMVFPLAEQDAAFWRAWFDKMDEPRAEREAWERDPLNPHGSFECHDPEDATREACEDYERTSDGN